MKSSVGVTICAVIVLIASALGLAAAVGAAFMFLGPLSGQFFDPANLPPGADVRMMRAAGLMGALFIGAFGALGLATGIGLIRLWKWARYSAIALGAAVILFSVIPGIAVMFVPVPPPSSSTNGAVPAGFRMLLAGIYLVWAAMAAIFVYVMMRKSTVAQFNGGVVEARPRVRPLSVTIIAWLMIASGLMTFAMLAWARLPAMFFGLVMTGIAAKMFYVTNLIAYAGIGVGLLRRPAAALTPAIALHAIVLLNALTMIVPGVWRRYQDAIGAVSPMFANQPGAQAGRFIGAFFGVAVAGVILIFLVRAKRTLPASAQQ